MTKTVRVENADTAPYKLKVTVQRKTQTGEWVDDETAPTTVLHNPAQLVEIGIHSHRRVVVEEA